MLISCLWLLSASAGAADVSAASTRPQRGVDAASTRPHRGLAATPRRPWNLTIPCEAAVACLEACENGSGTCECAGPPLADPAVANAARDAFRRYDERSVFLYLHMRKAGGTSMLYVLQQLAHKTGRRGGSVMTAQSEYKQFPFSIFCDADARASTVFATILRDPLERLVSLYHYSGPGSKGAALDDERVWHEWLDNSAGQTSGGAGQTNYYVRRLAGTVRPPSRTPAEFALKPASDPACCALAAPGDCLEYRARGGQSHLFTPKGIPNRQAYAIEPLECCVRFRDGARPANRVGFHFGGDLFKFDNFGKWSDRVAAAKLDVAKRVLASFDFAASLERVDAASGRLAALVGDATNPLRFPHANAAHRNATAALPDSVRARIQRENAKDFELYAWFAARERRGLA